MTDTHGRQCLFIIIEREQPLERPQNRYFDPNPVIMAPTEEEKPQVEKVEEPDNGKDAEKELDRELLEQIDNPTIEKKARSESLYSFFLISHLN
jgi:hypothetical protein